MRIKQWDYKGGKRPYSGTQEDWNKTIVTEINKLDDKKEKHVIVPVKFKSIFEKINKVLLEGYKLEFVDTKNNIIYINLSSKLEVINF